MSAWSPFPYDNAPYLRSSAALKKHWPRLHAGDAEPLPLDDAVLAAWAHCHGGEFRKAFDAGLAAGGAGITVANKAQAMQATYLQRSESRKLAMFLEVAERAEAQARREPGNASAHYWRAYALGRYSQVISVVKALAQGLGLRVRSSLETAIELAPAHADAHVALGAFHAEVIDKVGKLLGRAQGADGGLGLKLFRHALELNPASAIARIEYATALVMIEGERQHAEADRLYAQAAQCTPMDATERLHVELARASMHD